MRQNHERSQESPTTVWGFLVGVEIEAGVDPEAIAMRLSDSLQWIEGTGSTTVEVLGQVASLQAIAELTEAGGDTKDDPDAL